MATHLGQKMNPDDFYEAVIGLIPEGAEEILDQFKGNITGFPGRGSDSAVFTYQRNNAGYVLKIFSGPGIGENRPIELFDVPLKEYGSFTVYDKDGKSQKKNYAILYAGIPNVTRKEALEQKDNIEKLGYVFTDFDPNQFVRVTGYIEASCYRDSILLADFFAVEPSV